MKLKKILASLTAAALAVTTMAFAPVSVSAANEPPEGTETVVGTFVATNRDDATSWTTSARWQGEWMQCVVSDANYNDNTYIKVTATNLGDYVAYPPPNWTATDVPWDGSAGVDLVRLGEESGGITVKTATDSTESTAYGYCKATEFTRDEYDQIGFNVYGIFSTMTIQLDVVSIDPTEYVETTLWSGSKNLSTAWSESVQISADEFDTIAGDKIVINFTINGEAGYHQLKIMDGSWTVLTSVDVNEYDATEVDTSPYSFTLNSEDAGTLAANGMVISGYDVTITSVVHKRVKKPAVSVTVTPDETTLDIGETTELAVVVSPTDTTDKLSWSSSDETVATVDENGIVTAVAEGKATITASANDNASAECEVTVISKKKITVAANNEAYGTASADKTEAAKGETVRISAEAAGDYQFDNWVVISGEVTLADEESENTSFTMPATEVEIEAVFSEIPAGSYAITVKSAEGGSAKASAKSAVAGTKITLTATPDKGYEFDKWIVSPETVVIDENNEFTMPEAAVTITPVFKKATYNIEVEVSKGGTASADKTTAVMGETVNITVKPDDGYDLSYIKVNGTKISGTSFTMPAENVKVVVTFYYLIPECNISMPEDVSVDVGLVSSNEEVFAAIFGNDYEGLTENHTLSVELHVGGESEVPAEDKALIRGALSPNQAVGLYLDLSLYKKIDDKTEKVTETIEPISLSIGVPDSIIADGRTYSVMRVHDGKAENIGGTFDSIKKSLTVSSALFSTYAIVYEDKAAAEPETVTKPEPVKYYTITTDKNVTASASTAAAGTVIDVKADFGYDAYVYCGTRMLTKITDRGSFVMPAGNVRIVSQENGYLSMVKNAAPNSYIFVYDADMNYIKTNGSVKGIVGKGKVTVKLGEEYAGRTVTLYKGRKSTKVKVASMVLDENGNATFTVDGGKNYTAVVE